ncbi:hypothetical protein [Actinomycetospora sp. CA-084318]|uniref:hypothetical protein n=1 Tax=Actinomycetospora sp. CA-084318 TaxID=3239892 RepID=UPI003D96B30A
MTVIAFPRPSALDAPTVSVPTRDPEATVPLGVPAPVVGVRRPVPCAPPPRALPPRVPVGYPGPRAYPVPPLVAPSGPAGLAGAPVPWGPPSGPVPVAPPVRARRPATAVLVALLVFVLLVGGGIAAYVGFSVGPAYSTGAVVGGAR